jgi:hypothetical protein
MRHGDGGIKVTGHTSRTQLPAIACVSFRGYEHEQCVRTPQRIASLPKKSCLSWAPETPQVQTLPHRWFPLFSCLLDSHSNLCSISPVFVLNHVQVEHHCAHEDCPNDTCVDWTLLVSKSNSSKVFLDIACPLPKPNVPEVAWPFSINDSQ